MGSSSGRNHNNRNTNGKRERELLVFRPPALALVLPLFCMRIRIGTSESAVLFVSSSRVRACLPPLGASNQGRAREDESSIINHQSPYYILEGRARAVQMSINKYEYYECSDVPRGQHTYKLHPGPAKTLHHHKKSTKKHETQKPKIHNTTHLI